MDRRYGEAHYTTMLASDLERGGMGLELTRHCRGQSAVVAEVFFWEAEGHFTIQTFGHAVYADIIESLVEEAKQRILIK